MLLCFLLWSLTFAVPIPTAVIKTPSGPVQGYIKEGIQVFHGIPYAAPPLGDLRLKSPQPAAAWNETLTCDIPPPMCPQFDTDNRFLGDEDCLYMNVYAPLTPSKPRPVFFWIYGGGYTIGDGWEFAKYDGTNITKKHDYIYVSHNYRLGPLGFLALDELKAESSAASTGNYALQDQVMALQWVQKNIASFGGDPNQVTILGESAGAFSVCWHLASMASKGLFHAAVMESGTCDSTVFFPSYASAVTWSKIHANSVGCDPSNSANLLTCLRSLDTAKIAYTHKDLYNVTGIPLLYPVMPWGPAVDGSTQGLLDLPLNVLKDGKGNYVPYIGGTNDNEGSIFIGPIRAIIPQVHQPLQESDVVTVLDHFFCNNSTIVNTILPLYPLADFENPDYQAARILRDWFFVCPTRRAHNAIYNQNSKLPWMYHFAYEMHWPLSPTFGDYHSSELNFVFDNWWPLDLKPWNATDQQMSDIFGVYWSNQIWNTNVNGPKETVPLQWPNWDPTNEQNIIMDVPPSIQTKYNYNQCEMWNQVNSMCSYCGCS